MKSSYDLLFCLLCWAVALAGCQSAQEDRHWELPPIEDTGGQITGQNQATPENYKPENYDRLRTHKALAVALAQAGQGLENQLDRPAAYYYPVGGYTTSSEAATAALEACEAGRLKSIEPTMACEVRRRDDQWIHNSWELTQNLAPDRPAFLWQLQEGDTRVYIAGSIHVLKPTLAAPPSYFDAYEESGTLVLEVDQRNQLPQDMQLLIQQHAVLPRDTTLSTLLSATDYSNAMAYLQDLGINPTSADHTKPAMLLLQAGLLEYLSIGYLPALGLENIFEDKLGNRMLLALETIEQQLQAATALPLPLQAELLTETIRKADSSATQISRLVHAWLSGNEDYLSQQFENSTSSDATNRWLDDLLIKRNLGMALGIEALLRGRDQRIANDKPQVVFVLVGAAHLVGKESVIHLLKKRGINTQRLHHNSLVPVATTSK